MPAAAVPAEGQAVAAVSASSGGSGSVEPSVPAAAAAVPAGGQAGAVSGVSGGDLSDGGGNCSSSESLTEDGDLPLWRAVKAVPVRTLMHSSPVVLTLGIGAIVQQASKMATALRTGAQHMQVRAYGTGAWCAGSRVPAGQKVVGWVTVVDQAGSDESHTNLEVAPDQPAAQAQFELAQANAPPQARSKQAARRGGRAGGRGSGARGGRAGGRGSGARGRTGPASTERVVPNGESCGDGTTATRPPAPAAAPIQADTGPTSAGRRVSFGPTHVADSSLSDQPLASLQRVQAPTASDSTLRDETVAHAAAAEAGAVGSDGKGSADGAGDRSGAGTSPAAPKTCLLEATVPESHASDIRTMLVDVDAARDGSDAGDGDCRGAPAAELPSAAAAQSGPEEQDVAGAAAPMTGVEVAAGARSKGEGEGEGDYPAPPKTIAEPHVFLSVAQAAVCQRYETLKNLKLPCWVPQRLVGEVLGLDEVQAGLSRKRATHSAGAPYLWATEFENVHDNFVYREPEIRVDGTLYSSSEAYYQHTKQIWHPSADERLIEQDVLEQIMETAVRAKVDADPNLKCLLRVTGEHPLLSLKPDERWGYNGSTSKGDNLLAQIWMRVRQNLLHPDEQQHPKPKPDDPPTKAMDIASGSSQHGAASAGGDGDGKDKHVEQNDVQSDSDLQSESDHSGDDSSRPPATQTGGLETSGPDSTPGSQPTDPSYKFTASLCHFGPGSGYSNGGTTDVPGWAANQAWTSKINDDFMQTMKDSWDNSLNAGGTEELTNCLSPTKEVQLLKVVVHADVPDCGRCPVAAASVNLRGSHAYVSLVSANPQKKGHGSELIRNMLLFLAYNGVQQVDLFADQHKDSFKPAPFFRKCGFMVLDGKPIDDPRAKSSDPDDSGSDEAKSSAVQRGLEAKWFLGRHLTPVVPMTWRATGPSLQVLRGGEALRAEARLLMCQLAVVVKNLYLQLEAQAKALTANVTGGELLGFAALQQLDSDVIATGRQGLLHYLTQDLIRLKWKVWHGCNAAGSDLRLPNATATMVVNIAWLLRVLPSLPTCSDDLAWDNNQQETPGCPSSVVGLGGKQGNSILKAALVALFHPLLKMKAVEVVTADTDGVLTCADVQQLFGMVHCAAHAVYSAVGQSHSWVGRIRGSHSQADREHLHCVLYLVGAILCVPVGLPDGELTEIPGFFPLSSSGVAGHPFVHGMQLQCFPSASPVSHKLGNQEGDGHGLYSGLLHNNLFAGPDGLACSPTRAQTSLQPWLQPRPRTATQLRPSHDPEHLPGEPSWLLPSDWPILGAPGQKYGTVPEPSWLTGTSLLDMACSTGEGMLLWNVRLSDQIAWDDGRDEKEARATSGATRLGLEVRDAGVLLGVTAFDHALDIDCVRKAVTPRTSNAFGVSVLVHHCRTWDVSNGLLGPRNCGCLSNEQLLVPSAAPETERALNLIDGFEATCIVAHELQIPEADVVRSQRAQVKAKGMAALVKKTGLKASAIAEYLVRDTLHVGEVVHVHVDGQEVTLKYTEEHSHQLPKRCDDCSRSHAHTRAVPVYAVYTWPDCSQYWRAILARSLVRCDVLRDKPLSTGLRLHVPESMDDEPIAVKSMIKHSDQLLEVAATEDSDGTSRDLSAVHLKGGMACELNADPTGRFAIGAIAIFVCCFQAVNGRWVGVFFGRTAGEDPFTACPGLFTIALSGEDRLCILPVQESVSRDIHISAYIEARNAAAQSLRGLMVGQRNCFKLCQLLNGASATRWQSPAVQQQLWQSLSPGQRPALKAGELQVLRRRDMTQRAAHGSVGPSAGSLKRPASGASGSAGGSAGGSGTGSVLPANGPPGVASSGRAWQAPAPVAAAVAKSIVRDLTTHAYSGDKVGTWSWRWPDQIAAEGGMLLQNQFFQGAVVNADWAPRFDESGEEDASKGSTPKSVLLVNFRLRLVRLWTQQVMGGKPRWDILGSMTVVPLLLTASGVLKTDTNRKKLEVPDYECSKTFPETIPGFNAILNPGANAVFKQFMAAVSDKVRGTINKRRSGFQADPVRQLTQYCQILDDVRAEFPSAPPTGASPAKGAAGRQAAVVEESEAGEESGEEDAEDSGSETESDDGDGDDTDDSADQPRAAAQARRRAAGNQPVRMQLAGSDQAPSRQAYNRVLSELAAAKASLKENSEKLKAALKENSEKLKAANARNHKHREGHRESADARKEAEQELAALKVELKAERETVAARDRELQSLRSDAGDDTPRAANVMVPWTAANCATMLFAQGNALLEDNVDRQVVTNVLVAEARRVANTAAKGTSSFFEAVALSALESETEEWMTNRMAEQFARKEAELDIPGYAHRVPGIKAHEALASVRQLGVGAELFVRNSKRAGSDIGPGEDGSGKRPRL